jgi:hypothetical protein
LHHHRPARRKARDLARRRLADAAASRERDDLGEVELQVLRFDEERPRGSDRAAEGRRERPARAERERALRGSARGKPLDHLVRGGNTAQSVGVLEREQHRLGLADPVLVQEIELRAPGAAAREPAARDLKLNVRRVFRQRVDDPPCEIVRVPQSVTIARCGARERPRIRSHERRLPVTRRGRHDDRPRRRRDDPVEQSLHAAPPVRRPIIVPHLHPFRQRSTRP